MHSIVPFRGPPEITGEARRPLCEEYKPGTVQTVPIERMKSVSVSDLLHIATVNTASMAIHPQTSMLYFYCAQAQEVKSIRGVGLSSSGAPLSLLDSFEAAADGCADRILIIDRSVLSERNGGVHHVPPDAILNLDPYAAPTPIAAGGGLLTRRQAGTLELLLIYRRARWDLPKGKQDAGESIESCAMREVGEELGIEDVRIEQPLGSTVHGYREAGRYMVKTTHWYEMSANVQTFRPQREEDIEEARWMTWEEARERIGFESLRRHMDRVRDRL